MKHTDYLSLIMALGAITPEHNNYPSMTHKRNPQVRVGLEDWEKEKAQAKVNKQRGLTEFWYGLNNIWALNQKSADKKAKTKGYL